jgi:glycosyltransferase involved in cell wall biosynthesis
MPVHNTGHLLDESVASVLAQSVEELELIAVDDHSTDDSWERLQRWVARDPRVRAVRNEGPGGVATTRNVGNEHAHAPWVALMDRDDLWLPDKLERQLDHLAQHPEVDLLGTHFELFTDDTEMRHVPTWRRGGIRGGTTPGAQPSFVVRAQLLREHPFDPSFQLGSDHELFLRLTHHGARIEVLKQPLVLVRRHGGNITLRRKRDQVRGTLRIYRHQLLRYRMRMSASGYALVLEHVAMWVYLTLGFDRVVPRRWLRRVLRRDPRPRTNTVVPVTERGE